MTPDVFAVTLTDGNESVSLRARGRTCCQFGAVALLREGGRVRIELTPARPVRAEHLLLTLSEDLVSAQAVFLNGYQSWTDSREYAPSARMRGLRAAPRALVKKFSLDGSGDYAFTDYPNRPGQLHGWSYGYTRRGDRFRLFASLSEENGFTLFRTDSSSGTITAEKETSGRVFAPGEPAVLLDLFLAEGGEDEVFDGWFAALGLKAPDAPPIAGYTSWYRHYQDISEEKLAHDLQSVKASDFPFEIFQIDDGWEEAVGDWLRPDAAKFPHGMRALRDSVAETGLTPGLWLAPFVCERKSRILREHPDWFLRDENGKFLAGGGNWSGICALDLEVPEARAYAEKVLRTAVEDWGFSFLKLDFLYAACLSPRPGKTRGQAMCEAMAFIRQCVGTARVLACGVPLMPAFGTADYCRIGCDVGLSWDDKPWMRLLHRERISTKNSLRNSVFRRQLNGRAFVCDPDVFLLRSVGNSLSPSQQKALAAVNALCGGVLFTSDDPAAYRSDQKAMLERLLTLRSCKVLGAEEDGHALTLRWREDGGEHSMKIPL